MKYVLPFLIFFGFFLFFPSSQVVAKDAGDSSMTQNAQDEIFKKRIIGQWAEGNQPYGIAEFKEGGIYLAWVWETPRKNNMIVSMKGKWWIENGRLYNTLSEMTPKMDFDIGGVVIDEIVEITDETMTRIDEDGVRYTNKKVK